MEDLIGLGKGSEKLIEVISNAIGAVYKPFGIRREADAEAYKIKLLESTKISQKENATRTLAEAKKDKILILDSAKTTIAERAAKRKMFNEIRRQQNLENVLRGSFLSIKDEVSEEEVDPDWMQTFIEFAEDANSEQMQELWSKVLAGETESPGSFSLRSLATLKKMSKKEALLFQWACQISSSFQSDDSVFVIKSCEKSGSIPGRRTTIDLFKYGFDITKRMILSDIGLIHKDSIGASSFVKEFKMFVSGQDVIVSPISKKSSWVSYHFTPIGAELSKLIQTGIHEEYYDDFIEKSKKIFLVKKN